ncbi:MAG: hypothetical protein R3F05_02145 [Planctomycetota bacterium]
MNVPPMKGPLRIETIDGHPWVVGDGMACLCGDRAEAEGLLGDLRLRLGNPLLDAVRVAFRELAARGWVTQIERDTTGAVCRAFDLHPDAPGFAAVCHPLAEDHVVIEVGEGIGDEDSDLAAAGVVASALQSAGLITSAGLREGAAIVTAQEVLGRLY